MMRYCVLYPKTENVHLTKDVGMIAYKLNKLYGYDAFVATYKNGEYPYLKDEVKGLKIDFIKKEHGHFKDIYLYVKKNAHIIDVLQIFHMTLSSVFYAFIYKMFNKNGIIFLKLDCTKVLVDKIKKMNMVQRQILNVFLKRVDIIGVEKKEIFNELKSELRLHKTKLLNISNGLDFDRGEVKLKAKFDDKEDIILSVGRIGSPEKNSKMLMDAFANIDENKLGNWKLVFVGPIEEKFEEEIDNYFKRYEYLKKKVIFKGPIYDRKELYNEYRKAKIFCLTSKFESVGIALIEAGAMGDVIISTNVGIADEIVNGDNGILIEVGDISALTDGINKLIESKNLSQASYATEKFCRENYDWDIIVKKLHSKIIDIKENDIYE